jgi:hypothetical protein
MFPDVLIDVAAAVICFASACYPALVGIETPRGEFQITHYTTQAPRYGGDILSFKETSNSLYTIHRVIDVPGQQRLTRLKSPTPKERNKVTGGCVNVDPVVFEELVRCCYASKLVIK